MRCPVTSNNYKEKYTKELTRNGYEVLIIATPEYKDRADNRKCREMPGDRSVASTD